MSRILVVEDDMSVCEFTARALGLDGHDVMTAGDGAEGLDAVVAKEGDFDLVLSDIRMPEMDGIALAEAVAARFPKLRMLLMTGYAEQRERAHALSNVVDVLAKPFTLADIRVIVSRALA